MKRFGLLTALASALVTGVLAMLQYGFLALVAPTLITNNNVYISVDGLRPNSWANPTWLMPLATLIIALVGSWLAYRDSGGGDALGLRMGAWAGVGALVSLTLVFAVVFFVIGSNPAVQEFVRASEPHPEARLPYETIAPLAAGVGALLGLVVGFFSLAAALVGGLLADLFLASGHTGDISRPAH